MLYRTTQFRQNLGRNVGCSGSSISRIPIQKRNGFRTKSFFSRAVETKSIGLSGLIAGVALGTAVGLYYISQDEYDAETQKSHPKTNAQQFILVRGIQTNRLMRLLDQDQQASLVNSMVPKEFQPGEIIYKQGETGRYYFIVESGECDVVNTKSDVVHTIRPGESFGENGFVLRTKRSATIKAKTKVRAWLIDRDTFVNVVLPSSKRLVSTFHKFASSKDEETGELRMTSEDFIKALNSSSSGEAKVRTKFLFDIADTSKSGYLDFSEYAIFDLISARPDAEFEIAFRIFDTESNGLVGKDDVLKILQKTKRSDGFKFDSNCNIMTRFFGSNGERRLRPSDFAQFFLSLTEEIPRQLFKYHDNDNKGYISGDQFALLIQDFGYGTWRLPAGIKERLMKIKNLHNDNSVVAYSEFIAFNEFLNHIPALDRVIKDACNRKGAPVTKDEFKLEALTNMANNVSPLEVDVIFTIFDTNRDGKIDYLDFKCISQFGHDCNAQELSYLAKTKKKGKEQSHTGPKSFGKYVIEFIEDFGLGAVSGAIGAATVYPVDLVKTRMQNQRVVEESKRLYKNTFDCFKQVITKEGVSGLYRGIVPQLMGVAPEKAIKLTVNDLLRSLFRDESKGRIYLPLEVLAGCGAGASQVIFTNPIEIVKIRLQVQGETAKMVEGYKPKGSWTIVQELGIGGLYRGASACLLRDVPFSGIYFPAYAAAKRALADEDGKNSAWSLLLAGALAGVPAASLVTPADVIKTRLQVEARKGESTYNGIRDCAIKIYQQEGFRAFWKGAIARVLRSSPQFGVTLWSYELLQRIFASELENPRPPTDAPIDPQDFESLRRRNAHQQLKRLEKMQ